MARRLIEASLTTRSARASLSCGLHWRALDPDIHLGYRKGKCGGKWIVRFYIRERQTYQRIELGTADDVVSEGTLDYVAAAKSAKQAVAKARQKPVDENTGKPLTVRSTVEPYIKMRDERHSERCEREVHSDAHSRLTKYVLENKDFAATQLDALTEGKLIAWRQGLASHLRETSRARCASDLKAALNDFYRGHRKRLPPDFAEIVRIGLASPRTAQETPSGISERQILDLSTIRKIIHASFEVDEDHDLGRLVFALAGTGARFSQLARMKVCDVQVARSRLLVPPSRKGKKRIASHTPVPVGQDLVNALLPIVEGRDPDEPLFCRWRHVQTGPAQWKRDSRGPWTSAPEMTRPWNAACERAGVAKVVPYALRHSSIVRSIAAGLPLRLVAALHDTSTAMIERHYSRWIVDGLEELAATVVVELTSANAATETLEAA